MNVLPGDAAGNGPSVVTSWISHNGLVINIISYGLVIVSTIWMWMGGPASTLLKLSLVGLLVVLGTAAIERRHTLCERCALPISFDGPAEVARRAWALKTLHVTGTRRFTIASGVALAVLVVGAITLAEFTRNPLIVSTLLPLLAILPIVSYLVEHIHKPLQPWCPWCHWGDGGDEEPSPEPTPPLGQERLLRS